MLTTKLVWTLCSDVEGACFKVVKRAWTKSLCSLEFFFLLDLFSNFFLEECSSLIPFCFPLFIMLKVMMTIRDAYLLSGSQWGYIHFEAISVYKLGVYFDAIHENWKTVCCFNQNLYHTVFLPDWTLEKWALSSFAFQHC